MVTELSKSVAKNNNTPKGDNKPLTKDAIKTATDKKRKLEHTSTSTPKPEGCFRCKSLKHQLRNCPLPDVRTEEEKKAAEERKAQWIKSKQPAKSTYPGTKTPGKTKEISTVAIVDDDRLTKVKIDSGADTSVLPAHWAHNMPLEKSDTVLRGFDGSTVASKGITVKELKVKNKFGLYVSVSVCFEVIDCDENASILIGRDHLQHTASTLDFGSNIWSSMLRKFR
ncbi:hypothetical protein SAMD00019534_095400 [Acytostelium subglobosum LB1]|uniref:hypothetical protein n=1 Tax=Acytostelium subglobosum LB1 TaxID=1410327 RepID=UPI000644DB56|nr:hypothetical protein SAMD00019534_095400 [Acytostelium subglobosum LB1]GAM26365.1 hypothetical protein SAMD00019534_095400 [Acytostelium subglobosum LB1]|eukprot:XP_012750919.1 hypothetical protein SAMD00019534_095400 [Acytostelium subglobosum LB1]